MRRAAALGARVWAVTSASSASTAGASLPSARSRAISESSTSRQSHALAWAARLASSAPASAIAAR